MGPVAGSSSRNSKPVRTTRLLRASDRPDLARRKRSSEPGPILRGVRLRNQAAMFATSVDEAVARPSMQGCELWPERAFHVNHCNRKLRYYATDTQTRANKSTKRYYQGKKRSSG